MNHKEIEKKVNEIWEKKKLAKTNIESDKPKKYVMDMFPYPSSSGLHVGHRRGYVLSDMIGKIYKMQGNEVLHPMGFDSFGLPAENYAIKTGIHPKKTTLEAIDNYIRQLNEMGSWYDWRYKVVTCEPDYYRWNQWIFLQLFNAGLAYKKKSSVNYCPKDETVLANEQVVDGKCERCKTPVIKKDLEQWFFKITQFADELFEELDNLDWPEKVKLMQKNWIGKSSGTQFQMSLFSDNSEENIFDFEVFTTRVDTILGMSYVVFAPEKITDLIESGVKIQNIEEALNYVQEAKAKSEIERGDNTQEKTGVQLEGIYTKNPINGENLPVFVSDYVIGSYGSGVVMAVPAHDTRDRKFAKKFGLPIKISIKPADPLRFVIEADSIPSGENLVENEVFFKQLDNIFVGWTDKKNENFLDFFAKNNNLKIVKQGEGYEEIFSDENNFAFQNGPYTSKGILA